MPRPACLIHSQFSAPWVTVGLALAILASATAKGVAQEPKEATAPASEASPATPAAGHSLHGESFNDGPRQAAVLLPGQGEVSFLASTTNPEALPFINQGVAQIHTFYYLEAERSFRQAAKLDPNCVMAYWGMAMANTNNEKRAKGFLKEAFAKAALVSITRQEQLYLDALNAKYKEGGDAKGRRQGYLGILETIVQEFPGDLNARTWLAMVTWENSNSGDGIGSRQAVEELLRSVERVAPMHPGMHHYRIHLWDSAKREMAESSAELYGAAAPAIAHAWHMPGHIYSGLNRFEDAAYQQEASARADHAAMQRDRIMPFEIHNYAHNNQWLATSLSNAGRPHQAIAVARNLVEQPRDPVKNNKTDGGSAQRSGRSRWAEALVRYELWDELVAATLSEAIDWSDVPAERREMWYTLGLAYGWKGDVSKTRDAIAELERLAPPEKPPEKKADEAGEAKPEENAPKPEQKPERKPGTIEVKHHVPELEALVLLSEGDNEAALKRLDEATHMRPEAKARFQLRAGKPELALETINKAVDSQPNQVPPLACQVEILHATGKEADAQAAFVRLKGLTAANEPRVPVFERLNALAAAWERTGFNPPGEPKPAPRLHERIDLTTLGPLCWQPYTVESFTLRDTDEQTWSLAAHRGRNVLLLFFLGGKCAHCLQQLQEFGKEFETFKALGTDIVAIGTDDATATRGLKTNEDGIRFPMPLLADPELQAFKTCRCHDDFENLPLHGTLLIDAEGAVRFQNISFDPFMDIAFLKQEVARVSRMREQSQRTGQAVVKQGCGQ
jgi:peroxiredoxin